MNQSFANNRSNKSAAATPNAQFMDRLIAAMPIVILARAARAAWQSRSGQQRMPARAAR